MSFGKADQQLKTFLWVSVCAERRTKNATYSVPGHLIMLSAHQSRARGTISSKGASNQKDPLRWTGVHARSSRVRPGNDLTNLTFEREKSSATSENKVGPEFCKKPVAV